MPQLNDSEYQTRRITLRTDWDTGGTLFRRLTPDQQWALHDFYLFTWPLGPVELDATRAKALATAPELTTRAGLAYRSFARLLAATREQQAAEARKKPTAAGRRVPRRTPRRPLVVTSIPVTNPDPRAMARLLLAVAREKAEKTAD